MSDDFCLCELTGILSGVWVVLVLCWTFAAILDGMPLWYGPAAGTIFFLGTLFIAGTFILVAVGVTRACKALKTYATRTP